jgi:predicted CxxxxCH...CXXCH cytochrome family protein
MKRRNQILIVAILSLAVLIISCSDLKKDLPTETQAGSQIHGQGWVDNASTNFHGLAIQKVGWSMTNCQECHGPDYKGGSSGSSCLTCHSKPGGPENCTVCHGSTNAAPPKDLTGNTSKSYAGVGAHQSHLISDTLFAAVACSECHTVPSSFNASGHIDSTSGAEILFQGSVVKSSLAALAGSAVPAYSHASLTCSNTYCHGYFPNGNKQSVVWNDVSGQSRACGSCHGDVSKTSTGDKALPKNATNGGTHPSDNRCYGCHPTVINSSYQMNNSKHMNGKIDF